MLLNLEGGKSPLRLAAKLVIPGLSLFRRVSPMYSQKLCSEHMFAKYHCSNIMCRTKSVGCNNSNLHSRFSSVRGQCEFGVISSGLATCPFLIKHGNQTSPFSLMISHLKLNIPYGNQTWHLAI